MCTVILLSVPGICSLLGIMMMPGPGRGNWAPEPEPVATQYPESGSRAKVETRYSVLARQPAALGTNRYGSSGSDTLTDSGARLPAPSPAPAPQSQPARVLLHISGSEMSASSGSGGSGATQPPEPLQSLLSLSPRLRAELLLTLLVAGPSLQESRRSSLNIDEEATHYSGCLNTQQWPHLLIVIVRDSFYHLSPQWPGIIVKTWPLMNNLLSQ